MTGGKYSRLPWEWEDDEVVEACAEYANRTELWRKNMSAYVCVAYRNLWDRLPWMTHRADHRRNRVSDDEIFATAEAYRGKGRGAFQTGDSAMYQLAYSRGLLEKMPWLDDPMGRTTEELLALAREYKDGCEFRESEPVAWGVLGRRHARGRLVYASPVESARPGGGEGGTLADAIRRGEFDDPLPVERPANPEPRASGIDCPADPEPMPSGI